MRPRTPNGCVRMPVPEGGLLGERGDLALRAAAQGDPDTGIIRAPSRASAATMRAAIRTAPISVTSRVYEMSRTKVRIWLITAAVKPGGAGTGTAAQLADRCPGAANSPRAAWRSHDSRWATHRGRDPRPTAACSSSRSTSALHGRAQRGARQRSGRPGAGHSAGWLPLSVSQLLVHARRARKVAADGRLGTARRGRYLSVWQLLEMVKDDTRPLRERSASNASVTASTTKSRSACSAGWSAGSVISGSRSSGLAARPG